MKSRKQEPRTDGCHASSDLAWVNSIMSDAWPRLESYLQTMVADQIEPSINEKLPIGLRGGVKFGKVTLGQASPDLGPIVMRQDSGLFTIDLSIDFASELDFSVHAISLPIGVKHLLFRGTLTVELDAGSPPATHPPFFGSLRVFFVNPPEVCLHFTGLAAVADCPGLHGTICRTITSVVNNLMVLPSRIAIDLNDQDQTDSTDLKFPEPLGVLQVTIKSGNKLRAADINLVGAASSDPYVTVDLGQEIWTSATVAKSCSPVWTQGNTTSFAVYDVRQVMHFRAFDSDWNADDFIGEAMDVKVEEFMKPGEDVERELPLNFKEEDAGTLTVATTWLRMPTSRTVKRGPLLFLSAKVMEVIGLPTHSNPPFKVRLSLGEHSSITKDSHPPPGAAPVAAAMQKVCLKLAERRMAIEDIGQICHLETSQVAQIIASEKDPKAAAKAAKEAARQRAATHPTFNEVIYLLIRPDEEMSQATVMLELLDTKQKQVAPAIEVPLNRIIPRPDAHGRLYGGEFSGPFVFQPDKANESRPAWRRLGQSFVGEVSSAGIQLRLVLSGKWLQQD